MRTMFVVITSLLSSPERLTPQATNECERENDMDSTISCPCGQTFNVSLRDAGMTLGCHCGREVVVPQRRELAAKKSQQMSNFGHLSRYAMVSMGVIGIILIVMLAIQERGYLVLVGILMILAGRVWLALQILREMELANALLVLIVPLMPTVFLFMRFEIAWKPFLCGSVGYILLFAGL